MRLSYVARLVLLGSSPPATRRSLGEHMQQIAIALACLAIVLATVAAVALVRNGGAA